MPEDSDSPAAHDGTGSNPDGLRRRVHSAVSLQDAIKHLADWFAILRAPPYTQSNPDERLLMAFESDVDHPVSWCAARSLRLSLDIETSLAAATSTGNSVASLDPLTRYILGRAAMRCMAGAPTGSSGLSLAYELLWPLMHGEAFEGSDDELAAAAGPATEARGEVEAEARRLRADPVIAARRFDTGRTSQALTAAAQPISLEACSHPNVRKVWLDLPFGRIVRTLASNDPEFGARLIAMLGNPSLVAGVLDGGAAGLDAVRSASVLQYLLPIFDAEARWTGETTAWMVVLHIEDRLVEILDSQLRTVRSGGANPQDPAAAVAAELLSSTNAILSRTDGPRLALEWFAHLIWSAILNVKRLSRNNTFEFAALAPHAILLNALTTLLEKEDWANPIRVWRLFSGGPVVAIIEKGELPKEGSAAAHLEGLAWASQLPGADRRCGASPAGVRPSSRPCACVD